jgi:hypothetical protein
MRRAAKTRPSLPPAIRASVGREQDDADLLAVHHLTVLCYTIQHRLAFDTTVEAWAGAWGCCASRARIA